MLTLSGRGFLAVATPELQAFCVFQFAVDPYDNATATNQSYLLSTTAAVSLDGLTAVCTTPAFAVAAVADVALCAGGDVLALAQETLAASGCIVGSVRLLLRNPRQVISARPSVVAPLLSGSSRWPGVALGGVGLTASDSLQCAFVALVCLDDFCYADEYEPAVVATTPATWISDVASTCVAGLTLVPRFQALFGAASLPLDTFVVLTGGGEDVDVASASAFGAAVTFALAPVLHSAVLLTNTSLGLAGSGDVLVSGMGLLTSQRTLFCHYPSLGLVTDGIVTNDTSAVCYAPPTVAAAVGVATAVSFNGLDVSNAVVTVPVSSAVANGSVDGSSPALVRGNTTWSFSAGMPVATSQQVAAAPLTNHTTNDSSASTGTAWVSPAATLAECRLSPDVVFTGPSPSAFGNVAAVGGDVPEVDVVAGGLWNNSRIGVTAGHSPQVGPASGGTVVTFVIMGLASTELLTPTTPVYCAVISSVVNGTDDSASSMTSQNVVAVVVTSNVVSCVMPAGLPVGVALLGVGSHPTGAGATAFVTPLVQFMVHPVPALQSVSPVSTLASGGASVVVTGSGFVASDALQCVFGDVVSLSAVWVSAGRVVCVAPPHAPGRVTVTVTTNGQQYFGGPNTVVEYVAEEVVRSFSPRQGSARGGTHVTVTGSSFLPGEVYLCQFGSAVPLPAVWQSTSTLVCITARHDVGTVSFGVTRQGAVLPMGALSSSFEFMASLAVTAVSPSSGVQQGGSSLTVVGRGFYSSGVPSCRFGAALVPATVVSNTTLQCTTPSWHALGAVSVEVTMNGLEFSASGIQFHYSLLPVVSAVFPARGPERGGTEVFVFGSNFGGSTGTLFCLFGRLAPVPATWISSEVCSCISPASGVDVVSVEVSCGVWAAVLAGYGRTCCCRLPRACAGVCLTRVCVRWLVLARRFQPTASSSAETACRSATMQRCLCTRYLPRSFIRQVALT